MRPEDILPDNQNHLERDGVTIRKGSVGAFLASANVWRDPASDSALKATAEQHIRELVPALHALGLFDVLTARDPALRSLIGDDD